MTGKGKSGKSAFAENLIMEIKEEEPIYYLATMECQDEASKARVERHRQKRADKPFITIEKTVQISDVSMEVPGTVLLECLINLTGNEMFSRDGFWAKNGILCSELIGMQAEQTRWQDELVEYLFQEILHLSTKCVNLVIISGDVSKENENYDAETMCYLDTIGRITKKLEAVADKTYKIVKGKAE